MTSSRRKPQTMHGIDLPSPWECLRGTASDRDMQVHAAALLIGRGLDLDPDADHKVMARDIAQAIGVVPIYPTDPIRRAVP